jgi:predicted transcriptional regulator YheO
MTRVQRHEAVKVLVDKGLLDLKNALSEVAQILGGAHSKAYTYLPDVKENL